jgi:hypothetical protein
MTETQIIHNIIRKDHAKNHKGRAYSADDAIRLMNQYMAQGHPHIRIGACVFVLANKIPDVVEFHSINSSTSEVLVNCVRKLLNGLAPKFKRAVTYYDNSKINDLVPKVGVPYQIHKVDQGEDRTYEAIFTLRSR